MTRRLVVLAHYDAEAEVKRYVLHHLRALREVATRLVFVSTAGLPPDELDFARTLCDEVVLRENVGYDFAMWRDAIARTDLSACDELVLTNSSVFGPLFPLAPIFAQMSDASVDAWGMTESREIDWHLQSYFLVFRRAALAAPTFAEFWRQAVPLPDKRDVIRRYEVGLSQLLRRSGLRLRAFVAETSGSPSGDAAMNPTIGRALALIRARMPFVKVELLRDNPLSVALAPIREAMEQSGYDLSLVELHRRAG